MTQYNTTNFILSWDMYGLESCINVTELDMQHTIDLLLDSDTPRSPKLSRILSSIVVRARMNPQRHYEVYSVQVDSSVSEDDLKLQFEERPQEMANLIRDRGNKIFSNRAIDSVRIKIR